MGSFRERLLLLRENAGLSRESLAMLLNVNDLTMEAYETGYIQPPIDVLYRISEIFGVNCGYVIGTEDSPELYEDNSVREIYVANKIEGTRVKKSDIVGTVFMAKDDMHGKDYYAYVMPDNSMMKSRIRMGDILIVRRQSYASCGDIVVAMIDEKTTVVRRYLRKGNVVTLTPECSGAGYEAVKIDTEMSPFNMLGKVVEVRLKNI